MPLFMHVHNLPGTTTEAVSEAHRKDVQLQARYGVRYLRYWVDAAQGKVFCLVDAPESEATNRVHREAHGLVADEIFQVQEGF